MSDSIEFITGEIRGMQLSLKEALDNQGRESREGRARIYKEIESTNQINKDTKKDVERIAARLDEIDTSMAEIEKWRQRLIGMRMAVWGIAFSVGVLISTFGKWIAVKIGIV